MPLTVTPLARVFNYNGTILADPNPSLSPEEVRDVYAATYPELNTAAVDGPEIAGDEQIYEFTTSAGSKG